MRYPASEKAEIVQLVEQSHLPAKRTLDKLGSPRATFYRWYERYREGGSDALADHRPGAGSSGAVAAQAGSCGSPTSENTCLRGNVADLRAEHRQQVRGARGPSRQPRTFRGLRSSADRTSTTVMH